MTDATVGSWQQGVAMQGSDTHDAAHWDKVKAGQEQAACRVGHHHGRSYGSPCPICTHDVIGMMTFKPDDGPWIVSPDGRSLYSDDFHNDVTLTINGDFWDDSVRRQYAEHLARILNTEIVQRSIDLHKEE